MYDSNRKIDKLVNVDNEVNESYEYEWYENEEKSIIKKDLLDNNALEIAKAIREDPLTKDEIKRKKKKNFLSSTQLRRFYFDVKAIEAKIKNAREADKSFETNLKDKDSQLYKKYEPLVKMLKSKAAYASNQSNQKITKNFKRFIFSCVNNIDDLSDFFAFTKYFEAVVGYAYGEGLKEGERK